MFDNDSIPVRKLSSSVDVIRLVRDILEAKPDADRDSGSGNLVEEICQVLRGKVATVRFPVAIAVVRLSSGKLVLDVSETPRDFAATRVPRTSEEICEELQWEELTAFRLDTTGAEGQVSHPKAFTAELEKIEEFATQFSTTQEAEELLGAMAQAVRWAQDSGSIWAGVGFRRGSSRTDSMLEVQPLCERSEQALTDRLNSLGAEWIQAKYRVRLQDA